eukprot:TRINITY_DN9865_c0_g1_i2.p1 TRINITY_DN9865_c0_g1~~TRINITY_DN9865_c0_g1_i2.p1  ORF type:complete len:284 (-),score=33.27 TRINITY_DN9865_c0_g1_i2:586-1344(-)
MKRVRVEGELGSGFVMEEGGSVPEGGDYRERLEYGSGAYEFPCVKLRGLPFECKEQQICEFLGSEPIDVLMVRRGGRFSGEAFVVLDGADLVEAALCKNEQYMGRRYVEVFRAQKMDYYKAIANEIMDGSHSLSAAPSIPVNMSNGGDHGGSVLGHGSNVIRMRGLPYSVTAVDIAHWFNSGTVQLPHRVSPDQILVCTVRGRTTGQGYVEFNNSHDASIAMRKNKHLMGSRYIELFQSDLEELQKAIRKNG